MATMHGSSASGSPAIRANGFWATDNPATGLPHQLFSDAERARLAAMASIRRFKKGETIYEAGEPMKAIFNVITGVVKTCRVGPDRNEHITAFLYPEDLFGLSEEGRYVNTAKAVTPVTVYWLSGSALRRQVSKDAELEFHLIVKLCHELRQAQHHAVLLGQRQALSRLAMFVQMQEQLQSASDHDEIYLPMDRTDIAEYVGMSLGAVSRGFRTLAGRGIIRQRDRRHVRVADREAFEELACAAV